MLIVASNLKETFLRENLYVPPGREVSVNEEVRGFVSKFKILEIWAENKGKLHLSWTFLQMKWTKQNLHIWLQHFNGKLS